MQTGLEKASKKTYIQVKDPLAEELLGDLINYLRERNMMFYTLTERNEGNQCYVDVNISIKVS